MGIQKKSESTEEDLEGAEKAAEKVAVSLTYPLLSLEPWSLSSSSHDVHMH